MGIFEKKKKKHTEVDEATKCGRGTVIHHHHHHHLTFRHYELRSSSIAQKNPIIHEPSRKYTQKVQRKYERYTGLNAAIDGPDNHSYKLDCFEVCALGNITTTGIEPSDIWLGPKQPGGPFSRLRRSQLLLRTASSISVKTRSTPHPRFSRDSLLSRLREGSRSALTRPNSRDL